MSFDTTTSTDVAAPWREEAACTTVVTEVPILAGAWIDEKSLHRSYAEQVCEDCPVRFLCALDAAGDPDAEGLRGGFYFSRGRIPNAEGRKMQQVLGITAPVRQRTRRVGSKRVRITDDAS